MKEWRDLVVKPNPDDPTDPACPLVIGGWPQLPDCWYKKERGWKDTTCQWPKHCPMRGSWIVLKMEEK